MTSAADTRKIGSLNSPSTDPYVLRNRPPVVSIELGGAAFGDYDYPTLLVYICEVIHAHRAVIRSRVATRSFLPKHRGKERTELEFHEALAIAQRVCELSRDPCRSQGSQSRTVAATDEPVPHSLLPERFSVDLPGLGGSEARDAESWLFHVSYAWHLAAERVSTVLLGHSVIGQAEGMKSKSKMKIKNGGRITAGEVAVADSLAIAEAAMDRFGVATEFDDVPDPSHLTALQKQALRCRVELLASRT